VHLLDRFADREAAERETVEPELPEFLGMAPSRSV